MLSQLRHKLFILSLFVFVLLGAGAFFFFRTQQANLATQPISQTTISLSSAQKNTNITITSEITGATIEKISHKTLTKYFELIDFSAENPAPIFGKNEEYKPREIQVLFTSLAQQTSTQQLFLPTKKTKKEN